MKYFEDTPNTTGIFPDTEAINSTGPSTGDGTPLIAPWLNDLWGAFQAMLDYAGLTPDGVTEAPGTSQILEAIQLGMGVGPGEGVQWWRNQDPAVSGHRVLLLQGQGLLRANYPDLDAAVYVGDGNNATAGAFWRAANADGSSRNIAGVYLILPDTRGRVPRGMDTGALRDPGGATRTLGDGQADTAQQHLHYGGAAKLGATNGIYGWTAADVPGAATSYDLQVVGAPDKQNLTSAMKLAAGYGVPRISTETRMHNFSTYHAIKY